MSRASHLRGRNHVLQLLDRLLAELKARPIVAANKVKDRETLSAASEDAAKTKRS